MSRAPVTESKHVLAMNESEWNIEAPDPKVNYKPVPGYDNYYAGDDGSIWSFLRNKWHRLKPAFTGSGGKKYLYLNMRGRSRSVHKMILEAFVGPRPSGMWARHFPDRDTRNNRLMNLSWATRKENMADKIVHGTKLQGERVPVSKLTAEKVNIIRLQYKKRQFNQRQLAELNEVHPASISDIILRKSWSHI